jgi:hypothetical protein
MNIAKKSDYHMHTVFSDGVAQIDEMVSAAIKKGLEAITITDHMPLPFDNRYAMHADDIEEYRRKIRLAQKKYTGQITIKAGLEFEYLQSFAQWSRSIADMGWDHLLASVHNLLINHRPYLVNGTEGEFKTLVEHFDHNIERVCRMIRLRPKGYFPRIQTAEATVRRLLNCRIATGYWPAGTITNRCRHWLAALKKNAIVILGIAWKESLMAAFDELCSMGRVPIRRTI